jgi:hypothetical protein
MYAVTDGFSGLNGTWDTPGTGMNFLVHNMVRPLTGAVRPGRPGKRGAGPAEPLTTSATLFTTSAALCSAALGLLPHWVLVDPQLII